MSGFEISHLLQFYSVLMLQMLNANKGLFKPKHVARFTLYCELCMTTWKIYISVHKMLLSNFLSVLLSSKYKIEKRVKINTPGLVVSAVCDLRFLIGNDLHLIYLLNCSTAIHCPLRREGESGVVTTACWVKPCCANFFWENTSYVTAKASEAPPHPLRFTDFWTLTHW
jgi:hypothetical protein